MLDFPLSSLMTRREEQEEEEVRGVIKNHPLLRLERERALNKTLNMRESRNNLLPNDCCDECE